MASGLDSEVDHNGAGFALHVTDVEPLAVALLKLTQQGQGIMVIDEAHGFAWMQGIQGTEDRSVAKALGDAARVAMPRASKG